MSAANAVRKGIDDWEQSQLDSAILHACNAVDGTARNLHPTLGNKSCFTKCLRENLDILGPMGAPGIDLAQARFPVVIRGPTAPDGKPDIADVIYGVRRCSHAHGEELPNGFALIEDAAGPARRTRMATTRGKVCLSDRMVFGLLAVAVLSPRRFDQTQNQRMAGTRD